jgi:glycosyltransferase involved in cell wall biosynthesis
VTKGGRFLGGASRIAVELAAAFKTQGVQAQLFCYNQTPDAPDTKLVTAVGLVQRVQRHVDWRLQRLGFTSRSDWELPCLRSKGALESDIIHFHDVFECVSPLLLETLSQPRFVCLTVHDCSPFTGGCLYPVDCRRFEEACGRCPQRKQIGRFDFTTANIKLRRRAATSGDIHFIFPSRWIQSEAEKSLPIQGRSHFIPNGFDPVPYMFPTRHEARERLGLSAHEKVVLMGAHSLVNPYKGATFALQAVRSVSDLDPVALVLGHPSPEVQEVLQGVRVITPGFVAEKARLANYYAAADLLLFPSLADNLPIMIQESMAAGSPVLAFNTGGIPEMIEHDKTGWLVERRNQAALNSTLRSILVQGVPVNMGVSAKEAIHRSFSMDDFVSRHLELYREVKKSRQ